MSIPHQRLSPQDDGAAETLGTDSGPAATPTPRPRRVRRTDEHRLTRVATAMLESLPLELRLVVLRGHYPRLLNSLAKVWNAPKAFDDAIDALLIDRRGNRQGFPFEVLQELTDLRLHHEATRGATRSPAPVVAQQAPRNTAAAARTPPRRGEDYLLRPATVRMLAGLPQELRLVSLRGQYPRVLNRIAAAWENPETLERTIEALVIDRRGNRQGFPFEVIRELVELLDHHRAQRARGSAPAPVRPQRSSEDNHLEPAAIELLETLPPHLRLPTLRGQFPRILNRVAAAWDDPNTFDETIDSLVIDRRGGRQGFPFEVLQELTDLRECHASTSGRGRR